MVAKRVRSVQLDHWGFRIINSGGPRPRNECWLNHMNAPIRMLTFVSLIISIAFSGVTSAASAKPATLTVVGTIEDADGRVDFSIDDLKALGSVSVMTHTPWTDDQQTFVGVSLIKLLNHVGARGDRVEAVALNDYRTTLSLEELSRYPVIVAYLHNGRLMRVRDKGPFWIIYPLDDYPELRSVETERKMVWQLRTLIVR